MKTEQSAHCGQSTTHSTGHEREACPRCVGSETAGKGITDWQYAVGPPSVWDPELGWLMRSGLCIYCDAAVYRGHDGQLWHAAADRYFRLPA